MTADLPNVRLVPNCRITASHADWEHGHDRLRRSGTNRMYTGGLWRSLAPCLLSDAGSTRR
eukprot:14393313-Alexandrium_andersonii.AAC.1